MTVKKKKKPNPKVKLVWAKKHKLKTVLVAMLLIFIGGLVYNKFLDYRNVQDMEQLLADFQRLEKDVEAETGEELFIRADCGSVGKFATSYACWVYLENNSDQIYDYSKHIAASSSIRKSNECRTITSEDASAYGAYNCDITIRGSNKATANTIFSEYEAGSDLPPN